jgi:peptide/nickel transport system permease protein
MLKYVAWRILMMIPTLFAISIVSFLIIQLPPGDFLTSYLAQLTSMGETVSEEVIEALRARYGLGSPVYVQYWTWMTGIVTQGDFGMSLLWGRPVSDLLWERVGLTVMVSASSVLFIWVVAIPIGIYSAVRQYSIGDYIFTFLGFLGLATPPFMLALIALWIVFVSTGSVLVGLFFAGVHRCVLVVREGIGPARPPVDSHGDPGNRGDCRDDPRDPCSDAG